MHQSCLETGEGRIRWLILKFKHQARTFALPPPPPPPAESGWDASELIWFEEFPPVSRSLPFIKALAGWHQLISCPTLPLPPFLLFSPHPPLYSSAAKGSHYDVRTACTVFADKRLYQLYSKLNVTIQTPCPDFAFQISSKMAEITYIVPTLK